MPHPTPSPLTLSETGRRQLAAWAADCVEQALPLFEAVAPDDSRPRIAVQAARSFASGDLAESTARRSADDAHAAAGSVGSPAAESAARAAGHCAATAHMASHALGAVAYAIAAAGAAGTDEDRCKAMTWAVERAGAPVRDIVNQLPEREGDGSDIASILRDLDLALRSTSAS